MLNKCPTISLLGKIPETVRNGRRLFWPSRSIWCIAYSHVLDQLRKKLDDKGEKNVFIGYSEVFQTYRLYNPVTQEVIINRDIIFYKRGV